MMDADEEIREQGSTIAQTRANVEAARRRRQPLAAGSVEPRGGFSG